MKSAEIGLETLWCEEVGMYLNRRTDNDEFSYVLSPTNFYALFSENVSSARIERILNEHLYNEQEFWGEFVIPSVSKKEKSFKEQEYWRGRIWGPMNFLVYEALSNHGLEKPCRDLAEKSNDLFLKEWRSHRHIHENYSAITGEGCDAVTSDRFYHWGGLLPYITLKEFLKKSDHS